jgi:hypothetical protein
LQGGSNSGAHKNPVFLGLFLQKAGALLVLTDKRTIPGQKRQGQVASPLLP